MIPELGKYAVSVLSAYGVSLTLLAVLVLASWQRGRKLRDELHAVETRVTGSPKSGDSTDG